MQQEIAYRFAATAVEGVSLSQARQIIDTFALALATCQACNNEGVSRRVSGGSLDYCPVCDTKSGDLAKGDRRHATWHCAMAETEVHCRAVAEGRTDPMGNADHSQCGPAVRWVVPVRKFRDGIGALDAVEYEQHPDSVSRGRMAR